MLIHIIMRQRHSFSSGVSLYVCALVLLLFHTQALAATATQSGDWSAAATWGGVVPTGTEEDIVIPAAIDVLLDQNVECGELKVMGTLTVDSTDITLTCDSLIVMGTTAEFTAGTNASRFINRFVLTLKGETSENFEHDVGGQTHDLGARALIALMGGTISIHAEDRVEWTHLDVTAPAGATQLTLSEAVDWEAGDLILITASTQDWTEVETVTVSSVTNAGFTVNLAAPLVNRHFGEILSYTRPSDNKTWNADMRAEVGLLSRNITIQGAPDSTTNGFGAHIMIHGPMYAGETTHPSAKGYITGVEIYHGGQKSLLARYPFHWHLVQDSGAGQYFSDNAVHASFNRGITIHGTDYTTVENNIFYDHIGHGVFLEDGSEFYNTIRYNVVALTKRPAPGEEVIPSDNSDDEAQNRTPASFWITNPNNTIEYNVAAGCEGTGFWFIFPTELIGPAAGLSYYAGRIADEQPLGSFFGNTAHSNMNGIDIFDRLTANHGINKNRGWANSDDHVFEQNTWYANDTALYSGHGDLELNMPTENLIFRDNVCVDNKHWSMLASKNTIEECLIVADSGENLAYDPRYFWRTYDGAAILRDSYLVGWDADNTNFIRPNGAQNKRVNWLHSGIETDHTGMVRMVLPDYDFASPASSDSRSPGHPRFWSVVLRDVDGTLTGSANTSIIANHPWLRVGDETQLPNSLFVHHSTHKFARISDIKQTHPDAFLTRTKIGTPTEYVYYINGHDERHQLPVIVNEGFLYTLNYVATPTLLPLEWHLREAEPGDAVVLQFPYAGNLTALTVSGTGYTSVAQIHSGASTTTGYYLDGDGALWVRLVAESTGYTSVSINNAGGSMAYVYDGTDDSDADGMTNAAEGGPSQDTDGDTVPDYLDANSDGDGLSDKEELEYALDPFSAADLRYEFGEHGEDGWGPKDDNLLVDPDDAGAYRVTNDAGIPYILLRDEDFVRFPGDDISTLRVRYKSDSNGTLDLYWATTLGDLSESRRLAATTSYTANSGYTIAEFDVDTHAEWAGHTITKLRLNTINATGATTWIDWIRAGSQGELPGPTDIVYVDFGHTGTETGARYTPWNLLTKGLSAVDPGGTIRIIKDNGDNDTPETLTITQPVTLQAPTGPIRIGTP